MAALGSEDWRNAIHAGVFSDGADRPSVPELPLLRETPRAKVRARVLDSLVERVRDVCREYSQRGAPRTHDSAGETPPARACAARSRLLLLRGVPDHKTGAVGSRCIATSRWLPDVAMHRAEATTAPRDHPVVPCPFPHLSLPRAFDVRRATGRVRTRNVLRCRRVLWNSIPNRRQHTADYARSSRRDVCAIRLVPSTASTDRHSRVQFQSLCVYDLLTLSLSLRARPPRDPCAAPQHSTHSARLCACQVRVPSLPRYTHMHTNQIDIDLLQLHTYTSEPQKTRANVRKRTVVFALATCGGLRPAALPRPRT